MTVFFSVLGATEVLLLLACGHFLAAARSLDPVSDTHLHFKKPGVGFCLA